MDNSKVIYKYKVEITDESTIKMPAAAKVISVAEQGNEIVLYAMVPFDNDPEITKNISIRVVGTGHKIHFDTSEFKFIGTVSLHFGKLMFHIFYKDRGYWG
jgi:hypothetical protein